MNKINTLHAILREMECEIGWEQEEFNYFDLHGQEVKEDDSATVMIVPARHEDIVYNQLIINGKGELFAQDIQGYRTPLENLPVEILEDIWVNLRDGIRPDETDIIKPVAVLVLFGADAIAKLDDEEYSEVKNYGCITKSNFATTAEASAYLMGIDDCLGWQDFRTLSTREYKLVKRATE